MNKRIGWEIERIILILIILANVLDVLNLLPPVWVYIVLLVEWTTMAYMIYVVSPTELIFGNRHSHTDFAIVLAFVILSLKNLISNAITSLPGLVAKANEYIIFTASNATTGIKYTITTAEMNGYGLTNYIPNLIQLKMNVAQYFTMNQQEIIVILTDGAKNIALSATPTGPNGMMLMFYNSLKFYSPTIQVASIIIGTLFLLGISIYAAFSIEIRKPSILQMLGDEKSSKPTKIFMILLVLFAFFIMVFNLLFEWMTMSDDAPLVIVLLIVAMILHFKNNKQKAYNEKAYNAMGDRIDRMEKRGEESGTDDALETMESADTFFEKTLSMLKDKTTVLLIISGLLVLHLITDVGNYLVPAITGTYQTIYTQTAQIGAQNLTIYQMIVQTLHAATIQAAGQAAGQAASQTQALSMFTTVSIIAVYLLSLAGLITLLVLPTFIWYKIYKLRSTKSNKHLPNWKGWHIGLVMSCIVVFFLMPIFKIVSIRSNDIVGVHLQTAPILQEQLASIPFTLLVALGVFAFCMILGMVHDITRRIMMLGPFFSAVVFFGAYIYFYFTSAFMYYAKVLVSIINAGGIQFAILPTMFILFSLTIIFFVTGFVSFLYEIGRD